MTTNTNTFVALSLLGIRILLNKLFVTRGRNLHWDRAVAEVRVPLYGNARKQPSRGVQCNELCIFYEVLRFQMQSRTVCDTLYLVTLRGALQLKVIIHSFNNITIKFYME